MQCKNNEIRWTELKNVTKGIDICNAHKVFKNPQAIQQKIEKSLEIHFMVNQIQFVQIP